jgi:dihydrodipicolinate reductase
LNIVIIDGNGGRMGKLIIEHLKRVHPEVELTAVGTNSIATSVMVKAGADVGATGENAVVVACRRANVIVGPIGIVIADALHGEITPEMAKAVGQSQAEKVLVPVNRCNHHIVGLGDISMSELVRQACDFICAMTEGKKP